MCLDIYTNNRLLNVPCLWFKSLRRSCAGIKGTTTNGIREKRETAVKSWLLSVYCRMMIIPLTCSQWFLNSDHIRYLGESLLRTSQRTKFVYKLRIISNKTTSLIDLLKYFKLFLKQFSRGWQCLAEVRSMLSFWFILELSSSGIFASN